MPRGLAGQTRGSRPVDGGPVLLGVGEIPSCRRGVVSGVGGGDSSICDIGGSGGTGGIRIIGGVIGGFGCDGTFLFVPLPHILRVSRVSSY